MAVRVEAARVLPIPAGLRTEASILGTTLFWEIPGTVPFEQRGEPFLAALLPIAMMRGEGVDLPDTLPVDSNFLANLEQLQVIFARWFSDLSPVPIRASVAPRTLPTRGRATGYSGGIDSSYSLDVLGSRIDSALLIDGIEFRTDHPELFDGVRATLGGALAGRGLELITVRTNVKTFGRELGLKWSIALGSALASSVHAAGFAEYHIAASNSWENIRPFGSHPITDPLWSSATTRIQHHGAEFNRVDKIAYLSSRPELLDHLRVCFQGTAYNCGKCHKCLMTMSGMRAVGATSKALPPLEDPRELRTLEIAHDGHLLDWEEILLPGLADRDPKFHAEVTRLIQRYRWRRMIRHFDEVLMRGRIRKLIHHTRQGAGA
ncbi:MAG TPA: hypothetical protein PLL69_00720 [Gemmatimonadales bacterium]|nr:hypothetical protein [Gemmatimonadales bacterium]